MEWFAKNDFVFKQLLGRPEHRRVTSHFLQTVVGLPAASCQNIEFRNTYQPGMTPTDKLGIVDVGLRTPDGRRINVEIQRYPMKGMRERLAFYLSRMVSEQLQSSDAYHRLEQSIVVGILDYPMIQDCPRYHHRYWLTDRECQDSPLTDKLHIQVVELPKLPPQFNGTPGYDFLKFLASSQEDEMIALAHENPVLREAWGVLERCNQEPELRKYAEAAEKQYRDMVTLLEESETRGVERGMQQGRQEGRQQSLQELLATAKEKGGAITAEELQRMIDKTTK